MTARPNAPSLYSSHLFENEACFASAIRSALILRQFYIGTPRALFARAVSTFSNPLTEYSPQMEALEFTGRAGFTDEAPDEVFSEEQELELAAKLLDIANEQELDQFLGDLIRKLERRSEDREVAGRQEDRRRTEIRGRQSTCRLPADS